MDFHRSRRLTIQSQNGTKNCGLLLVGPKKSRTEIDCEGESRVGIPCVSSKFQMQCFSRFFDTVDRLRALTLTIWFFSAKLSGTMNRRDIESLKYSAELGRNTGGPLDSKRKRLIGRPNGQSSTWRLLHGEEWQVEVEDEEESGLYTLLAEETLCVEGRHLPSLKTFPYNQTSRGYQSHHCPLFPPHRVCLLHLQRRC